MKLILTLIVYSNTIFASNAALTELKNKSPEEGY
jgi:hypothetical protein